MQMFMGIITLQILMNVIDLMGDVPIHVEIFSDAMNVVVVKVLHWKMMAYLVSVNIYPVL